MPNAGDCPSFATLGSDIKTARKTLGITRKALAEKAGIDPRYLANIENSGDIPSVPVLYELARECKLPLERYFSPDSQANESPQRQRISHKLQLCPDAYLPIIEGAIDGAIKTGESGKA